ncbi:MAG: hypothetical protein MI892_15090 [Desulfobacterales bacterium]|nr:hypothetical protein [Desulfobacterales bacterium]
MDEFLDTVWVVIEGGLESAAKGMDILISPLEVFGPAWVILILAFATVGLTRVLVKVYRTRRHENLKKEFLHWQSVREEAMKAQDRQKGKAMAKNIDQAKLNKVYYDYFFEGLMKNLVTTVLPVLVTIAYLSRTYTKQNLEAKFGNPWIFTIGADSPILVGTLFWYIICLILGFILFAIFASRFKKGKSN